MACGSASSSAPVCSSSTSSAASARTSVISAASALARALRSHESRRVELRLHHALRRWHGVLLIAHAFALAYSKARALYAAKPPRGRAPGGQAEAGSEARGGGSSSGDHVGARRATSLALSLVRLSCGTPGRLQLLQWCLGRWCEALLGFEAREHKKEAGLANERARNLKRGWKEEREARIEADGRVATAEASASEARSELGEARRACKAAEAEAHQAKARLAAYADSDAECVPESVAVAQPDSDADSHAYAGRAERTKCRQPERTD